ncbi:MAG: DUF2085 domain-containing protein [Thermoplasmata archaeon]
MATKLICHARPERSFSFRGRRLPICSRCTGFYLFLAIGLTLAPLLVPAGGLSYTVLLFATLIAVGPLAVDGMTQLIGWRESNNYLRFLTGSLAGTLIGVDITAIILDALFL